jgi:hypothetical protein
MKCRPLFTETGLVDFDDPEVPGYGHHCHDGYEGIGLDFGKSHSCRIFTNIIHCKTSEYALSTTPSIIRAVDIFSRGVGSMLQVRQKPIPMPGFTDIMHGLVINNHWTGY